MTGFWFSFSKILKQKNKRMKGVAFLWIFPQDLKVIKSISDLGKQDVIRKKKSEVEYSDYIYPLTPKKAEPSFMSCAENKGRLQFCMAVIANEIA